MTTTTRRRRGVLAIMLAVAALFLSGCMRMHQTLTLNPGETVSGEVIVAISEAVASTMGTSAEEMMRNGDTDAPDWATEEPYSQDGYTGMKYTFSNVSFEDFEEFDSLTFRTDGGDYVAEGESLDAQQESTPALTQGMDVRISVTFPGQVTESNGEIDGRTVTWTMGNAGMEPMYARGPAGGGFPLIPVLIGVGVLALAGVVAFVLLNRRKSATEPAAGSPSYDPTGQPQAHYTQQPPSQAPNGQAPYPAYGEQPPSWDQGTDWGSDEGPGQETQQQPDPRWGQPPQPGTS